MNAPPIDLRPEDLRFIRAILQAYVPDAEVWAFGSRVQGTARTLSDLDIVIRTSAPLDILVLASLRDAFSVSPLPFRVDVLDWSVLPENMRRIIEAQYVVLKDHALAS